MDTYAKNILLASGALDQQRDYWLSSLPEGITFSSFPAALHPSTAEHNRVDTQLPDEIAQRVLTVSRGVPEGVFVLLSFGVANLLARYNATTQSLLASPILANTQQPTNTFVPLLMRVEAGTPFKQALTAWKNTVTEATKHQDFPLDHLAQLLHMPADLSGMVHPKVVVVLQGLHDVSHLTGGRHGVEIVFGVEGQRVTCTYHFDSALFNACYVQRLHEHLTTFLRVGLGQPECTPGSIDILSDKERDVLLHQFNGPERAPESTTVSVFREAVTLHGPRTAVVFGSQQVTYAALDQWSDQLARRLVQEGIHKQDVVGIHAEPSVELVVAVLGIHKVGGVCLSLDPEQPHARLENLLRDAGAKVLLTRDGTPLSVGLDEEVPGCVNVGRARLLPSPCANVNDGSHIERGGTLTVDGVLHAPAPGSAGASPSQRLPRLDPPAAVNGSLDPLRAQVPPLQHDFGGKILFTGPVLSISDPGATAANHLLPPPPEPRDPAYIIYTSGTTGEPKGVVLEHRSVVNVCSWYARTMDLSEHDHVLKYANVAFDASVLEIHSTLSTGASLHIVDNATRLDLAALKQMMERDAISCAFLPTLAFERFAATVSPPSSLTRVSTGGDRLRAYKPAHYRLLNMYGPTESTVVATAQSVFQQADNIPIGKPIDNACVHVVDPTSMQLQPVGIPGEICVGGVGLARGYINRPDLTAQRFIPDPHRQGATFYRTGDLARWLDDGSIQFLGRMDNQVKVRGIRIEPSEIEAQLLKLDGVTQALVSVVGHHAGSSVLCAYVACTASWTPKSLKSRLRQVLPDALVPAHVMCLDALPINRNGKVDTSRLPDPSSVPERIVVPADEIEAAIRQIWAEILGQSVETISTDVGFMELGGHSLLATAVVGRIHQHLGVRISLHQILGDGTIQSMAALARQDRGEQLAPIPRAPALDQYPLSAAQRRLYVLQQLEGGASTVYNIPIALELHGPIDQTRLRHAFSRLMEKHEGLRTSIHVVDGQPVQRIHPNVPFTLRCMEASEDTLRKFLRTFVRPFDLSQPPLLRATLLSLSHERHVLAMDLHHTIADAASMRVITRDIIALYLGGNPTTHPVHYKDYIFYQQSPQQRSAMEQQSAYWLTQFKDGVPTLQLMTDFPRPAVKRFEGGKVRVTLGAEHTELLRQTALENNVTTFVMLLSAFGLVLSRITGEEQVVIGTPVEGRRHPDLQGVVGMLVNTLPIRIPVANTDTVQDLVANVGQRMLDALENQDFPFDELVHRIDVPRDPSRNPIFDVMFSMQGVDASLRELKGLTVNLLPIPGTTSKFDLNLTAFDDGHDVTLELEYDTALFRESSAAAILGCVRCAIQEAVSHPQQAVSQLELTTAQQRQHCVDVFNNTHADYPEHATVVERFEQCVAQDPVRPAVHFNGEAWSYGELNARANTIAYKLRDAGVGREQIVALLVERSLDTVAAILGVLKAGAAYLPIDPGYPAERIRFLLDDSGARACVHSGNVDPALFSGLLTVALDDPALANAPTANPQPVNTSHDLAYVIYTSGTTGKPKGVMVEHRNIVRLLINSRSPFDFNDRDVWTLFHSYSFDFSVWELFGPLLFGGQLVVVPNETTVDMRAYVRLLHEHHVTVLNHTPSVFYQLAREAVTPDALPLSLRVVVFGGEALCPAKLSTWHQRYPDVRLVNMYGITETTVHVTWKDLGEHEIATNAATVGVPIPTTTVFTLDRHHRLLPPGVAGELCVGGAGVARGYLKRDELTQQRFIPNPYGTGTLYCSGDYGRINPHGEIDYLGRMDHQVQLQGFRIELGEIEAALVRITGIQDAVVLDWEDTNGNRYLAAYLVCPAELAVADIRSHLGSALPAHMIPSRFFIVERIPVTSNGKADRAALQRLAAPMAGGSSAPSAATPLEQEILSTWQRVLDTQEVGIHDNFFEMGGTSIRLIQVHAELTTRLQLPVRPVDLFVHPTVHGLAQHVATLNQSQTHQLLGLKLPPALLVGSGEAGGLVQVPFTMDGTPRDTVLALAAYTLFELSGQDVVSLHAMVDAKDRVDAGRIDFNAVEGFAPLIKLVASRSWHQWSVNVDQLAEVKRAQDTDTVRVLFVDRALLRQRAVVEPLFDVIIEMNESTHGVTGLCASRGRVRDSFAHAFVDVFRKSLEAMRLEQA